MCTYRVGYDEKNFYNLSYLFGKNPNFLSFSDSPLFFNDTEQPAFHKEAKRHVLEKKA